MLRTLAFGGSRSFSKSCSHTCAAESGEFGEKNIKTVGSCAQECWNRRYIGTDYGLHRGYVETMATNTIRKFIAYVNAVTAQIGLFVDDCRVAHPAPNSTIPAEPSTTIGLPSAMTCVASSAPFTSGIPNSRATIAAWEKGPPTSVIAALAMLKSGVQIGVVV